jgi:CheY-like chemotaxis protein
MILLPVQAPAAAESTDVEDDNAPPRGSETALVVEDDPEVRDIVATMRDLGYRVLEAAGLSDAMALSASEGPRIELLVTDVVMPEISGPELADRLRLELPHLKVLFMSGYNDDDSLSDRMARAEAAFVRKPFSRLILARRAMRTAETARASAHPARRRRWPSARC